MARAIPVLVVALTILVAGCVGGGDEAGSGSTVACDDVAFSAQEEELYVTRATVSNAIGGGGDPSMLLVDLRRARTALAGYLEAHPPCDEALLGIAEAEREAIADLDEAIAALAAGEDAGTQLASALAALEGVQSAFSGTP